MYICMIYEIHIGECSNSCRDSHFLENLLGRLTSFMTVYIYIHCKCMYVYVGSYNMQMWIYYTYTSV